MCVHICTYVRTRTHARTHTHTHTHTYTHQTHYICQQSLQPYKDCKVTSNCQHEPRMCCVVEHDIHALVQLPLAQRHQYGYTNAVQCKLCTETGHDPHNMITTHCIQHDTNSNTLTTKNMQTNPHVFIHTQFNQVSKYFQS